MSQPISSNTVLHVFDDQNITWFPFADIEHIVFAMLDLDVEGKVIDFVVKFEANERIVLHRHLSHTNTFVIQGEHRLYHPNGDLKEIRPVGSYTSSPPGEPHYEGAGDVDCVVMYNIRGDVGGQLFEIMDDDSNVIGILGMDDVKAAYAEQKAA